jgi:outer membrane protein
MKTIKVLLAALIVAGFGLQLKAQNAEPFSLQEAIDYALEQSISVKQAEIETARAKQQVREYTSIGLPQLSGKFDYNYNVNLPTQFLPDFITPAVVGTLEGFQLVPPGTSANLPEGEPQAAQFGVNNQITTGVTLSQLVFDGSYFVGLKAAKGLVSMTKRQEDLSRQDIPYQVKKAYLTVLIAEENSKTLAKNIENLQKLRDETKAFYDNGLVEQLDVDRLDLSLANLQSEAEIVNRQIQLAYNVLKFQMNFPLSEPISLTDSLTTLMEEPTEEDLKAEPSAENRIELDVLRQSEYLNDLNIQRYKMSYAPSLGAFFTHQYQLQRNDLFDNDEGGWTPITVVGASLTVPIFDGFNKDAKIKIAKLDKTKISLQIKQFQLATELEITNARTNYVNAKQRLANQEKSLALAERILETTKIKYKEGIGSSMEISTAEQELYRTQANYMNALYDVAVAKTDLDKALGKSLK